MVLARAQASSMDASRTKTAPPLYRPNAVASAVFTRRRLRPSGAFATFVVALLLFVFGLYFIGWIVFPEPVASSFGWAMSGGSLILFFMALFAYVSVFACCICIRTRMSRSNDIEGETAIQLANRTAAPTPAPALRDVGHPSKVLLTNGKTSSEI